MTATTKTTETHEGYQGLGKVKGREMRRRWKAEGQPRGLSLKEWARSTGIGDQAFVWLEAKKTV